MRGKVRNLLILQEKCEVLVSKEVVDWENYSDDKSIILIIYFQKKKKKVREKSLIEIVLDIISKPKKRQQTLRVPMQTSNCLFVNKLTTITYMFPSNLINHIAVL